jgi:CheY-like chemotaxis protein
MAGLVLVVDDEEGIRVLCRVNLELSGFTVLDAADGRTGVELARTDRPDVIFLDVMMPVMDGYEVLRQLKDDPATEAIPVVMLTARTSTGDQARAWGGGVVGYVAKPFDPQLLSEWAADAIEARPAEVDAERRERALERLRLLEEMRHNR